jgi:hypothetical protein
MMDAVDASSYLVPLIPDLDSYWSAEFQLQLSLGMGKITVHSIQEICNPHLSMRFEKRTKVSSEFLFICFLQFFIQSENYTLLRLRVYLLMRAGYTLSGHVD